MISDGMAWHYKDYEKEQTKIDRDLYSQAEQKARIEKIGLWKDANAIKPSDFRRARR
jgi:endonuclease YncB( thermonuclease family)